MGILGYILALGIGITLGLMGSGGSILTVPVFVYLFHIDPNVATTYSLFAIAVSSSVGSINNIWHKNIDFQKIILFGLPSILVVFLTRQFILPLVPEEFEIGGYVFSQNEVLMVLFAFVMYISAFRMIRGRGDEANKEVKEVSKVTVVGQGAMVGFVTGVVGAGGGFLIIPALVNFYRMPIKSAVATSLAIISLNSIFGLLGDLEKIPSLKWSLLGPYTFMLIVGMFLGFYCNRFFNGRQLKKGLGALIFLIATYILSRELALI